MRVVGIDPGLTGAIAILGGPVAVVADLPTVPLGGNGLINKRVYGPALRKLILQHCPPGETMMFVVEAVATMGGANNAVQTQGSLMRTKGTIETVIELLGHQVTELNPQKWKGFYGLVEQHKDPSMSPAARNTAAKRKALECARRMWPACSDIGLAKHHNRAEALLIANYGLRNLT